MFDAHDLMHTLAVRRPAFHSEADFQHAFAWALQRRLPDAQVRLELPIQIGPKRLHLDIWLVHQGNAIAIELKYPTGKLTSDINGEAYQLAGGAADYTLYDYIKDIERLEQITSVYSNAIGYAVMLTNDRAHWMPSPNSIGAAFRLTEGRQVQGSGTWSATAGRGSTTGYERDIVLTGSYPVTWHDYSRIDATASGSFRYLVMCVPAASSPHPPQKQG